MQRLLDEFATLFNLDYRIHGSRLGDLVVRALEELEQKPLPDWGDTGPRAWHRAEGGRSLDFYYAPHLFPEMDVSLRLAHKLQFGMLPREVPSGAPLSVAAVLESYCHLSGDLFGWKKLTDGKFLLWIVDLSGHGVTSGLSSAVLKVLIDNLQQRGRVASLTAELNERFIGSLREDRGNHFATGFFLALSPDGSGCYTSAGHPPVFLRRANGELEELGSNSLPIGMFPEVGYETDLVRLRPGDMLFLYTDGVIETQDAEGEQFGVERLKHFLEGDHRNPKDLTREMYGEIAAHQQMDTLEDDVTFLTARYE